MAVRVALFGTERRADFKHTLQATAHAELLEQLRGLVEEGWPVKVLHWKQIGAAFGGRCNDFWRVGLKETFRNEVFSAELEDLPTQAEHGVHVGSAKVEKTVVEARVEFDLHGVRDAQRERGLGTGDHGHRCRQHFVGRRWRGLAFLDLWGGA